MNIAAVIPAAGYGSFRPGVPKIVESIEEGANRPMIGEAVRAVRQAGADPIVVVTNRTFDQAIAQALKSADSGGVVWTTQPDRFGALDAVMYGLACVPPEIRSILVTFADMPLWRPGTIRSLIDVYRHERPAIAMVSISIEEASHPRVLERYGRILRNKDGEIVEVVEPGDATPAQLAVTKTVNPSKYLFDRDFLNRNFFRVRPRDKGDGYPPEKHVPPLIAIAARQKERIIEVPLRDKREALGVNTPAELEEVRRVVADWKREAAVAAPA